MRETVVGAVVIEIIYVVKVFCAAVVTHRDPLNVSSHWNLVFV